MDQSIMTIITTILNTLVLVIIGLVAYANRSTSRNIEITHKRIDVLKEELKAYRTKEVCDLSNGQKMLLREFKKRLYSSASDLGLTDEQISKLVSIYKK